MNMRFKVGKRLAIVGENGSGKTTFIKLLCRLYDPQEGQILLNGIDIRKYRYDDYMGIFSVVFQDFQLICQPLGNNVAGSMEYDRDRAKKALIDAGFADRLAAMEKGLDTMLYKNLSEDGVEVSGGEAQKIAIARALYKDARWTPSPRRRSTASSMRSQAIRLPSISPTACPPANSATRSPCSTRARSSSRAVTPNCSPIGAANTTRSGTHRRSIIRSKAALCVGKKPL